MNYIASFFTGTQQPEENQLTQAQIDFVKHLKTKSSVFQYLEEKEIENMLRMKCLNLEFSQIVRNKNGKTQDKKQLFLSAKMTMRVQDIVDKDKNGEDLEITIPCMCVENE